MSCESLGTSLLLKLISISCRAPNSLHHPFIPLARPSVRQGVNTRRYVCSQFLQFKHIALNFTGQIIAPSEPVESDCQYRKTLVNVVMKLSSNASAFLFLRFDQLSTQV